MDLFEADDPASQALPYADITDPQSLNKFSYTYNNPLRYVDPDGHCPICELEEAIEPEIEPVVESGVQALVTVGDKLGPIEQAAGDKIVGAVTAAATVIASVFRKGDNSPQASPQPNQGQAPNANNQPNKSTKPAPQDAAEHTTGPHTKGPRRDKHEKVDPGQKQPPNYEPYKKYVQPKDDKKKDAEKKPYFRKDRYKKKDHDSGS